jgi:hypothetical protein
MRAFRSNSLRDQSKTITLLSFSGQMCMARRPTRPSISLEGIPRFLSVLVQNRAFVLLSASMG